jgi:hypothetical protein
LVSSSLLEDDILAKAIGLAVLLASFASVSTAGPITQIICKLDKNQAKICTVAAPEMDLATGVAGLTLLVGGLVVLRARTARKNEA